MARGRHGKNNPIDIFAFLTMLMSMAGHENSDVENVSEGVLSRAKNAWDVAERSIQKAADETRYAQAYYTPPFKHMDAVLYGAVLSVDFAICALCVNVINPELVSDSVSKVRSYFSGQEFNDSVVKDRKFGEWCYDPTQNVLRHDAC